MTASQRRQPAHSPSSGPASAVITIGAKKKIDVVSASCSVCSAMKLKMVEPNRNRPRSICAGKLTTRNIAGLRHPLNSTSTSTTWRRSAPRRRRARPCRTARDISRWCRGSENSMPVASTSRIADSGVGLFVDVSGGVSLEIAWSGRAPFRAIAAGTGNPENRSQSKIRLSQTIRRRRCRRRSRRSRRRKDWPRCAKAAWPASSAPSCRDP